MVIGQNEEFTWDYSEYSDILNIHKARMKTKGGAEIGDFTIDFDAEGRVIGVEIMHAAEFFEEIGISKEQLRELKRADFMVDKRNAEAALLFVRLYFNGNIRHSVPMPLSLSQKSLAA